MTELATMAVKGLEAASMTMALAGDCVLLVKRLEEAIRECDEWRARAEEAEASNLVFRARMEAQNDVQEDQG